MSILCHILCFYFEVRPAGRQLSDPDTGDVHNRRRGYPFIKQRLILKTWRQTSASADLFVSPAKDVCTGLLGVTAPPAGISEGIHLAAGSSL